ncbi:hypothetical protein ACJ73_07404 [Blastomyces percursus]|uniref:Uncharacterized protein n=1 Tax=Blastomyces percursus TaxID=1658174 RepID=A0A1J9PZE3_9EURO|nr:hypothetical protein ACJ73_07404 [Blastomyces percursus]
MPDSYPHTFMTISDTSNSQYSDKQATPHVHGQVNFFIQDDGEAAELPEFFSCQKMLFGDIDTDRLAYGKNVKYLGVNSGDELYPSRGTSLYQRYQTTYRPRPSKSERNAIALKQTSRQIPASIAADEEGLPINWQDLDDLNNSLHEPDDGWMKPFQQDDYDLSILAPGANYVSKTQQLYGEEVHYDLNITYTNISLQLTECPSPAPSDKTEGTVCGGVSMSNFGEYDDVDVGGGEDSKDAGEDDKYSCVATDALAIAASITPHIDKDDTDDAVDDKGAVVTTAPADTDTDDNNRNSFVENNKIR